jgi:HSP20 family protein
LFEDFESGSWLTPFRRFSADIEPFWREYKALGASPAVDFTEKENAYEVTAELPGLDEKNIEVKVAGGGLTIKGEKEEDKEEKKKGYYLHERHYGSFERYFRVPEGVDADKIEATFKNGVLKVTLPKMPGVKRTEKKIEVRAT